MGGTSPSHCNSSGSTSLSWQNEQEDCYTKGTILASVKIVACLKSAPYQHMNIKLLFTSLHLGTHFLFITSIFFSKSDCHGAHSWLLLAETFGPQWWWSPLCTLIYFRIILKHQRLASINAVTDSVGWSDRSVWSLHKLWRALLCTCDTVWNTLNANPCLSPISLKYQMNFLLITVWLIPRQFKFVWQSQVTSSWSDSSDVPLWIFYTIQRHMYTFH
jgi:hypothetical protein